MDKTSFLNTYLDFQELASGGTGVVYRAYHANLGKYVILKRAKTDLDGAMMRREVDILKNLRHRYLPVIYDYITVENQAFVVEDYIDGWDLNEYLKREYRPGEEDVVRWLRQLCEVLDYLHTRTPEIIHSDIKPGNIMVDQRGDICLIDFNISVLQGKDKTVLGYSNYYCAPEQREQAEAVLYGKHPERVRIDSQTDIYSLCATFYALLSGCVPSPVKKNRPLTRMKLPYSEALCTILDRGMIRERSRRIKSARQMLKMLNHMERLTLHFRRYCAMQAALTAVSLTMIALGAVFLLRGTRLEQDRQMGSAIRSVYSKYEQTGGTQEVERSAEELLSSGDTYWEQHPRERAQVLAIVAECQFETDTRAGYQNAAERYAQALLELERAQPDRGEVDEYALNYAAALFMAGRGSEVETALSPYLVSQEEVVLLAMQAEEAYDREDYHGVLEPAEKLWNSQAEPETKAIVSRLAALAAEQEQLWDEAVQWSQRCLSADGRDTNRRKTAALLVRIGDERGHRGDYQAAEQVLAQLSEWTGEDYLSSGEIAYRLENYSKCTMQLEKLITTDGGLLCRRAYLMSACALAQGDRDGAVEWGSRAALEYRRLTERQRGSVDIQALRELCESLGVEKELGQ